MPIHTRDRTGERAFMEVKAFTLIEIILAMAITVVVTSALATVLYTAYHARANAMAAAETNRQTDLAGDILIRELGNALPPSTLTGGGGTIVSLPGSSAGASTTGTLVGPFEGTANTLDFFVSGSEAKANIQGDVREVYYQLEPDPSGGTGQVLTRQVTTNLLAAQVTPLPEEVICKNVVDLEFSYYDGSNWNDTWDSTAQTNLLPMAVQVTLILAPVKAGGEQRMTLRVVPLSCAKPAASTVALPGSAF
jgi:type II secretory pathway pseudopilin PulG